MDRFERGLGLGAREIADVWRTVLRGPFGREFLDDLKARAGDSRGTGYTISRMKVHDYASDGVEIGVQSNDRAQHPTSKRANARSIGVWLESGTRMHLIPTRVSAFNHVAFNGVVRSRVTHPGTKAARPMYKTLRVFRSEGERMLERELDRRLASRMGLF